MNENAVQVISMKNKSVEAPQKSMKSFFRNRLKALSFIKGR